MNSNATKIDDANSDKGMPLNFTILIGTHRSGTTWLGKLLSQLPSTAYWSEPRQVWTYKNWNRDDDALFPEDATPMICSYIRNRFTNFAVNRKADHFVEKTPSNCLRVDYVRSVIPEGKFILVIRDGRAVFSSTDAVQSKGVLWSRLRQRIEETSIREWPAYFTRLPWLFRKISGRKLQNWGVRPPGWRAWAHSHSGDEVTAYQWSESILAAVNSFERIPESQKLVFRYEDLVADPKTHFHALADFLDVETPPELLNQWIESSRMTSVDKWRTAVATERIEAIRPIIEPTLNKLGYQW